MTGRRKDKLRTQRDKIFRIRKNIAPANLTVNVSASVPTYWQGQNRPVE